MNQVQKAPVQPQSPGRSSLAGLPTFVLTRQMARVAKENPDWSAERLSAAEHAYRMFMRECRLNPHSSISPSADADKVWHAHILFTRQYAQDCTDYCGQFIHHNPFDTDRKLETSAECCRPCDTDPNAVHPVH